MIFDYSATKTFQQSIDVVDPGNTGLRCTSDEGFDYYIIIKSIMGQLNFLEFGPVMEGVDSFIEQFSFQYKKAKYSEKAILKEVNGFINDPTKKITEIVEVLPEEIISLLPDLATCWSNI